MMRLGFFKKIVNEVQLGHRVCCAFLTDGVVNGGSAHRRNQGSLSVLKQLGVQEQDIFLRALIIVFLIRTCQSILKNEHVLTQ